MDYVQLKYINFFITTVVAFFLSILFSFLFSLHYFESGYEIKEQIISLLQTGGFLAVYVFISMLFYYNKNKSVENKFWMDIFRIPIWTELKGFCDQKVAKISYWALLLIPILTYVVSEYDIPLFKDGFLPLNIKLTFFASWFFSIALILFSIGCPSEFRNMNPFETAKNVNVIITDMTKSNVNIEFHKQAYNPVLDNSSMWLRAFCFLFFLGGILNSLTILIRSAIFVIKT